MEKNDLLLLSEVIFQINSCETMLDLEQSLFYHINLLIPFHYASYIEVSGDDAAGPPQYNIRFCKPRAFAAAEKGWLDSLHIADTTWLSSSTESQVVRGSEIFQGNRRLETPSYQQFYQSFHVFDDMQINVVCRGKTVGRLSLYRTQEDGPFSDQDAFNLRLLSKHINLAVARCGRRPQSSSAIPDPAAVAARFHLTRREEEILGKLLHGMDNTSISQALSISINTLYKHNNSIFQKCGVKSRWELLKLLQ